MGFTPLELVDVSIGPILAKLYPKITPSMPVYHTFQVNKAALTNLPTDFCLVLDVFGVQLNTSSTMEGIISDWRHFLHKWWMNFDHLTILSFHKTNSNCINETTIPNQPEVLLLVINRAAGDCHKQNIKFVHVQCMIDFSTLITIEPYSITTKLQSTYYIELSQGTQALINGNNQNYNLVILLGAVNLRTFTSQ
jgi:hypothetical protein